VIHDKETQDSGSDDRYTWFLPSRQDTEIVGVYHSYEDAACSAKDYVEGKFGVTLDEDGDGDKGEDGDGDNESDSGPQNNVDWIGEGWFRQEEDYAHECDDRVHIMPHDVS
jgi:hypothetical protein